MGVKKSPYDVIDSKRTHEVGTGDDKKDETLYHHIKYYVTSTDMAQTQLSSYFQKDVFDFLVNDFKTKVEDIKTVLDEALSVENPFNVDGKSDMSQAKSDMDKYIMELEDAIQELYDKLGSGYVAVSNELIDNSSPLFALTIAKGDEYENTSDSCDISLI